MGLLRSIIGVAFFVVIDGSWAFAAEAPALDAAQTQAVQWLKKHNDSGPDARIVNDMSAVISEHVAEGENINLYFGKDLMKSGTFESLHIWGRYVFSFSFTDAQATAMELESSSVQLQTKKRQGEPAEDLPFELTDLKVEQSDGLDPKVKFTGTVTCRSTGTPPEGEYALRVGYQAANNVNQFQYLTATPDATGTEISFSFGPITGEGDEPHHGPTPLFFDIVTVKESGGNVEITSYSNGVAAMGSVP